MDAIDRILPTVHNLESVTSKDADEKTALKAFDAYFVGEMLRRGAPENPTGLMDGGQAGRMYQEHLYQELGRIIAENTDFGLASTLEGHLGRGDDAKPEASPGKDEK